MMSELTRLRDEAERLLTTYVEYKHCDDLMVKTRVHIELDRFLMQHRETAAILMLEGLNHEIEMLVAEKKNRRRDNALNRIWKRIKKDRPGLPVDSNKENDKQDDDWVEDPDQPKYFNQ